MFEDFNRLEIAGHELAEQLGKLPEDVMLIDVREEWELARGVLPGAGHRPLSRWQDFISDFNPDTRYIVYCEHGVRSLDVVLWMKQQGISACSVRGGFAEWQGDVVPPGGNASE